MCEMIGNELYFEANILSLLLPVCTLMCRFKSLLFENPFPHSVQDHGRTPVRQNVSMIYNGKHRNIVILFGFQRKDNSWPSQRLKLEADRFIGSDQDLAQQVVGAVSWFYVISMSVILENLLGSKTIKIYLCGCESGWRAVTGTGIVSHTLNTCESPADPSCSFVSGSSSRGGGPVLRICYK